MNKIYSKVWNKTLGHVVVASELANSDVTGSPASVTGAASVLRHVRLALAVLLAFGMVPAAMAGEFCTGATGSSAAGTNAFACGTNANASGNNATAVGYQALASGESSSAFGDGAQAIATGNTAIGVGTTAGSSASTRQSVAIGAYSAATGDQSTALGNNAMARGDSGIAIGGDDLDLLANRTYTATVHGSSVTATGAQLFTSLTGSTAIQSGTYSAAAAGDGSVALGPQATAGGTNTGSFVAGAFTNTGVFDIAIGAQARSSGFASIALGAGARATADTSFAIGPNARATAASTLAIGTSASASQSNAVAIGTGGTSATTYTQATGLGSTALGGNDTAGANASGKDAIAIGGQAASAGVSTIAVGRGAKASSNYGVAIGDGASATNASDVALGRSSVTSATTGVSGQTINGTAYTFAGATPAAAMSVGNRQVQNVSAGQLNASSTDAVNGSQLFATNQAVNAVGAVANNSVQYDDAAKTGVTLAGVASTDGGLTNGTKISNVAQGNVAAGSTDAVNGSQLNTTNTNIANVGATAASLAGSLGGGASYNPTTNTYTAPTYTTSNADGSSSTVNNVGAALASINSQGIKYFHANSTAADSQALGLNSVAIGPNAKSNGDSAVAMGNGAVADLWGIAIGGGAQALTNTGGLGAGSIALGLRAFAQGDGSSNGDTAGTQGAAALAIGDDSKATADGSISLGEGSSATQYFATTAGQYAHATGRLSTAIGGQASATGAASSAIGAASSASADNAVALGAGSVADVANTVSVGAAGAERKVVNVANGDVNATSTDAVNGSQLDATNTNVSHVGNAAASLAGSLGGGASYDPATNTYVAPTYTTSNADGSTSTVNNVGDALSSVNSQGIKYFHTKSTAADSQAIGANSVAVGPGAIARGSSGVAVGRNADARGQDAVAMGNNAVASGGFTIASGNGAKATGVSSAAYGDGADASYNRTTAIGGAAATSAQGASAFGNGAKAKAANSVALGSGSIADVANTVSVGSVGAERKIVNVAAAQLTATSTDAVNGSQLYATNQAVDAVAVTANNSVQYDDAAKTGVTFGGVASTDGGLTNGTKLTNVAQGDLSNSSTDAVNGSQLNATNQSVSDLANTVVANKTHYYSVNDSGVQGGNYDNDGASGLNALAAGINASASANRSTAVGTASVANATGATAVGADSSARGNNSTAIGRGTSISAAAGVAAGYTAFVSGVSGVAIGTHAGAVSQNAIAIGTGAVGGARSAVALGANASVTAVNSVALGASSTADGSTLANAAWTPLDGSGAAIAVAGVAPVGEVSVGSAGSERRLTHVAAGSEGTDAVNVSQLQAVDGKLDSLSSNAVQYDDAAKSRVTFGGVASTDGGLTHGTTLSNVAQGDVSDGSTDAVNGTQLYDTNTHVATNATNIAHVGGAVSSVAAGLGGGASYDATTNTYTAPSYTMANADGSTSTVSNVGDALDAINSQGIRYFHASSTAADSQALGLDSVAVGPGAVATNAADVALGSNSITIATTATGSAVIDGTTYTFAGATPTAALAVGGRQIQGVAAGQLDATSTDAVNGSQLYATNQAVQATAAIANNSVQYDDASKSTVTLAGPVSTDGGLTGGTRLTNVAQGDVSDGSTDAVNGTQLNETNQNVAGNTTAITTLGGRVTTLEGTVGNISNGSVGMFQVSQDHNTPPPVVTGADSAAGGANATASGDSSVAIGNNSTASGDNSSAFGNGATASGNGSTAIGHGAQASADGSVALGSGSSDGGRGSESYVGKYSGAQNDTVGTVSVGNAATGETRTVSNVADGQQATDAVNVRQLDGAVQVAKDYTDTQISNVNTSVSTIGAQVAGNTSDIANIQKGADGMFQVSADANTSKPTASGNKSVAAGNNAVATGNNTTALGDDATASGQSSTALGNGAQATGDNSVAIGAGSVATRSNAVSVGGAGSERQVTNVAAGTESTDAVNVSQLKATQASGVQYDKNADGSNDYTSVTMDPGGDPTIIHNVRAGTADTDVANVGQLNAGVNKAIDWSRNYTDQRFNSLDHKVNTIGNRANGGIASAMAMASLPQAYQPNQSSAAVALGNFHGETGIAVGVSTISESGHYVFKLNATTNTRGDAGVGVGAGVVW